MSKVQNVFLIGAKSLGAYGGYETFVYKLTEYHQNNPNIKYHVACKANGDGCMDETKLDNVKRVSDSEFEFHNARCFKIHIPQIGPAQAIYYDVAALRECCKYIKKNNIENPIVYIMACRIGPFAKHFYKEIHRLGGKVYLNPDGHEWMRAKWSKPIRKYWKISEQMMVKYCDLAICDSVNIEKYIHEQYDGKGINGKNPNTTFIAYGADLTPSKLSDDDEKLVEWYKDKGLSKKNYYLVVGRFVPENSFEIMIREFMKSKSKRDFALITNVNEKFLNELENKLHFRGDSRIKFVGTVYDQELLKKIREKVLKGNVRTLLKKKSNVMEDFRANTSSYKRQMSAIRSLKSEEYSARNLKDILLNVEEPEEIPTIFEPKFIAQKLNPSQQQAVKKALNSENIGLIQGPPGTGKTKVIKEIIGQVVTKSIKTADSPRILIVSQSHTAVDNILEGLDSTISDDLEIVRIGADKNVSPKISCRYTMPAHRDKLFSDVKKNVEEYDKSMEEVYQDISDQRVLDRWKKIKEIQKDWIDRAVEKDCLDYQLVRSATVIAGTCIGFLANSFVKDMEFDYVIIDEAAKATTPELLVSIIKAKKIILVGDQNQLPAYADQSISPKIAKLTKDPEYRMFDILFETLPDSHKQVLSTQYRMIRNIGNLISTVFYGGTIDTGCKDEDKLHGLSRYEGNSIIWFDTSENRRRKQKKTKGNSFMNEEEKRIILDILDDLKKSNELDNQDIGIITGYSGQKDILRNSVKAIGYDKIAQIDINVLDAFQGRENDIIMYSTVRTDNSIGFQKEKERVNVAFSRAKKLLIICGDLNFFYNYNDPNNKFIEIIDYIRTHDHCKIISCKGGNLF